MIEKISRIMNSMIKDGGANFSSCQSVVQNQPMIEYYDINIMSVQKCTQYRANKVQYLTPARSSLHC